MTQKTLGAALGMPQSSISRRELGLVALTYEQVLEVETVLHLDPGSIAEAAGYVRPSVTTKATVYAALHELVSRAQAEVSGTMGDVA